MMNNINDQKQYSPPKHASLSPSTHHNQIQHTRSCYCPIAMTLKLKLINLSSENQVLKKKLAQIEQELENTNKFQHLYNSVSKTHRIARSSKQTTHSEHLSLIAKATGEQQNAISGILDKASQLLCEQSIQKKEPSHRLETYEYFRKLAAQDKQTVKSLEFSFDSKSLQESRANLQYDQQEFFSLRQEYEQMLQNLQVNSQKKIRQLQDQIQALTQNNRKLEQIARSHQSQILESEEYEIRKTGYFKPIQQEENEDSISEMQPEQTQISQIIHFTNFNESNSLSTENLGEVAEQMRDLKSTLQNSYQFLRKVAQQLKILIELCKSMLQMQSKVKVLPINDYLKLVQQKRKERIANKKYELLTQQNKQLREIIGQLTSINKHHAC